MQLAFDSKELREICESDSQARLDLGDAVAEMLKHRLADMRAAKSAKDLVAGKPRTHPDSQHMLIDLSDGYTIVFKANHTNNPLTEAGDLDWAKVTRIKILRIDHA